MTDNHSSHIMRVKLRLRYWYCTLSVASAQSCEIILLKHILDLGQCNTLLARENLTGIHRNK